MAEDTILSEFLRSLGPWQEHVVIGGGYAPIIYKLYLSASEIGPMPVGTQDVDSLIARNTPPVSEKSLGAHLRDNAVNLRQSSCSQRVSCGAGCDIGTLDKVLIRQIRGLLMSQ